MSDRGTRPHQAGKPCPYCHGAHGPRYCLTVDYAALDARASRFRERAAAHSMADVMLRPAQRWQHGVTDLDVAAVLYAIEADEIQPRRTRAGRWVSLEGQRIKTTHDLSTIINEMIRTGLVRHIIDHGDDYLVPALVHFMDGWQSVCRFTGEDLGPMRARVVDNFALVDCLECEAAIGRGAPRGL